MSTRFRVVSTRATAGIGHEVKAVGTVLRAALFVLLLMAVPVPATGAERTWQSAATGEAIAGHVLLPKEPTTGDAGDAGDASDGRPLPTIVYLTNLSIPRLGQESDDAILADLLAGGHQVIVLDYAHHPKAVSPDLNADILKLRRDVAARPLLDARPIDPARLFVLPEGFRLRRDVPFYRDGQRVLAMDVWYPSKPSRPVPAVLEITCDNKDRMGNGSLVFCHDTLLEGAAIAGFAAVMVDHPVAPPYKGLDPMPDGIYKLKAAVRTLRALGPEIGLNGNIGVIGFSRGSNPAALLAATGGRPDLEGDGAHPDVPSRVQAALVHGHRFDFLRLRDDDPMRDRFIKAFGPLETNRDRWAALGAVSYLTRDAAPMFLNTSHTESAEFRDGLARLAERLTELGVEHVYAVDADDRGHRVTSDPKTLAAMYAFLESHLRNGQPVAGQVVRE